MISKTASAGKLRERQKAETYALILKTARDLFEEIGFEKTTIRMIAARAEISPGAIFKHFENKSSILGTILFYDIEITQQKALNTIPQSIKISKQFLYIADHFFKYYGERPVLSKILVKHGLFIEGEWAKKFEDQSERLFKKIVQLVRDAQKRLEIRKDICPEILSSAFMSHYMFVLVLCVKSPEFNFNKAITLLEPLLEQTITGALQTM